MTCLIFHSVPTKSTTSFLLFTCLRWNRIIFTITFIIISSICGAQQYIFNTLQHLISPWKNTFSIVFFSVGSNRLLMILNQQNICLCSYFYRHKPQMLATRCSQSMNSHSDSCFYFGTLHFLRFNRSSMMRASKNQGVECRVQFRPGPPGGRHLGILRPHTFWWVTWGLWRLRFLMSATFRGTFFILLLRTNWLDPEGLQQFGCIVPLALSLSLLSLSPYISALLHIKRKQLLVQMRLTSQRKAAARVKVGIYLRALKMKRRFILG